MKIREISLIVWFSTSVGLGSLTFADSVSPDPPDAFEAFSLELTVLTPHGVDGLAHSIDISTADGTILVGYLGVPGPIFTSPPWVERTITVAVPGLPSGTYAVKTAHMHDLADGDIEVIDSGLSVTVADAPATQPVHAFFHTGIEHYFITAWDNEANGLLAQNGWEIVDFGFNVWHADDPAPEAAVPVCRFYSELVNSHFYTGG